MTILASLSKLLAAVLTALPIANRKLGWNPTPVCTSRPVEVLAVLEVVNI